jgi:hypothetical protein
MGKPKGKRSFARLGHRWENSIKLDLQEVGWGHGLDWSGSGLGQVVGTCECSNERSDSTKCGECLDQLRNS